MKLFRIIKIVFVYFGLSRAYEELKLFKVQKQWNSSFVYRVPMRNWNRLIFLYDYNRKRFIACLWGIETGRIPFVHFSKFMFIACLWGIETLYYKYIVAFFIFVYRVPMRNWNPVPSTGSIKGRGFIACLWGIETKHFQVELNLTNWVYRVPMRNWNYDYNRKRSLTLICLSRAYEELKQWSEFTSYFYSREFIACLWGIETGQAIFSIRFWYWVYRVPMRNWNLKPLF